MATIRKHYGKWQGLVRRVGNKVVSKTFVSKTQARKWCKQMEVKLDRGDFSDYSEASKLLLGDLLKRFINEGKHTKKKSFKMYEFRCEILRKDTIADINLLRLSSKHLAEFKDRKLKKVGPSTFNKYLSLLSVVIDTAMQDWGIYLPQNPCRIIKREKEPRPRDRILKDDELSRLLKVCSVSKNRYLKHLVLISIETAMRVGELLAMRYDQIDFEKRTLLIPETKTGRPRTIPLSTKALELLKSMPRRLDGKVFPLTIDMLEYHFKVARHKANIKGFRWHDLRRHACSLLFEKGLSVPEVQLFSGHSTPTILLNTYTKLSAEKIARKLMKGGY